MISYPSSTLSSVVRLKRVTEAVHQGAGRYMIRSLVTVNPLISIAAVTVLTSWKLNCDAIRLPKFIAADPSVDQLCMSHLGALSFSVE